jgi:hypothetical protein
MEEDLESKIEELIFTWEEEDLLRFNIPEFYKFFEHYNVLEWRECWFYY